MKYTRFLKRLHQLGGIGDNLGAWSGANRSLLLAEVGGVIGPLQRSASRKSQLRDPTCASGPSESSVLSEASLRSKEGVSQIRRRRHSAGGVMSASLVGRSSTVDLFLEVLECVLCLADG
jgi:hypothetical protein